MRRVLLLGLCVFALAKFAPAQIADSSDGSKPLLIPAPENFTEATSHIRELKTRFGANHVSSREFFGVYVPTEVLPRLAEKPMMDLEFFARVSINRKGKNTAFTQKMFDAVVADLEKNFGTYLDPKGPVMKKAVRKIELHRRQLTGEKVDVSIDETTNLGFFEKTDNVFSAAVLTQTTQNSRRVPLLATLSCIRVNDRLIVLNIARVNAEKEDFEKLPEFTKKWTAAIIEANK